MTAASSSPAGRLVPRVGIRVDIRIGIGIGIGYGNVPHSAFVYSAVHRLQDCSQSSDAGPPPLRGVRRSERRTKGLPTMTIATQPSSQLAVAAPQARSPASFRPRPLPAVTS
ncbi:hypothetical protein [Streptomyces sp. NPDC058291]|uniref:hypothetical protein n=1 Tax=Streptomyces sp. NPDC058291 TaxID=3346427 RepID=UPI0036EEA1A7